MKTRTEAIAIARTWLETPYVLRGRIKGAGCDCGTLLAEYMIEIGATTTEKLGDLGLYSHDWFCNTKDERYLRQMLRFCTLAAQSTCRPGAQAQPGDLVLFRVVGSRVYNHGAIITAWPRGIHAQHDGVREVDLVTHSLTAYRQMDVFNPFGSDDAGI
jgi:cell wall-associated NlpC family hydrolase